ncbi:MAG: CHAT domain-containing protein [Cyanobacteria bacterium J06592_8]
MKPIRFYNQLRLQLTTVFKFFAKPRFHRRSTWIAILLFIFSLSFSPIIARSQSHSDIVSLNSDPEVAQVSESNLIEQAKFFYAQQQFEQAAVAWQQAVIFFTEQRDPLNQAIALSNLCLTYQQLGRWNDATQVINQSLNLLNKLKENRETAQVLAQTLDIQGSLELAKGNPQAALDAWKRAFEIYQDRGNLTNITQNQINQAQALQILGRYNRAVDILEQTANYLSSQPESAEKAIAFVSLGDVFRVIGNPDEFQTNLENSSIQVNENPNLSQFFLKKGLEIAEKFNLPEVQAAALISLGNLFRSQIPVHDLNSPKEVQIFDEYQQAQQSYQQAVDIQGLPISTQIQAQLNEFNLSVIAQDFTNIENLQISIQQNLQQVPLTQTRIYNKLNLVQSLMCWAESRTNPARRPEFSPLLQSCFPTEPSTKKSEKKQLISTSWEPIFSLTQEAIQDAQQLQSIHAEAYAFGYLAAIYQQNQDFIQAEKYTRQALELESISSYETGEITYLLQWQLGRLQKAQQKEQQKDQTKINPTIAYQVAFQTLNSLRRDLLEISSDVRYSFRDSIEPLYREYVDLLLKTEDPNESPDHDNLKQARTVIEALQLAEINDFFQDACTEARPQEIDTVVDRITSPTTVIYPIILEDRIEVILKLPGKDNFYHYRKRVKQEDVEKTINEGLSAYLSSNPTLKEDAKEEAKVRREQANKTFIDDSSRVYDWLIRPAEEEQKLSKETTLVFVLDGVLRKIPMAALYDSKQQKYLIEKYAIAVAPGLQLLSPEPFSEISLNALLAGVGKEQIINGQKFTPLEQVKQELNDLQTLIPLENQALLNENFSIANLKNQLEQTDLTVVHIATHGKFSSNLDESFIVAWNELLTVREIDRILREQRSQTSIPIELLTLSACETAEGDDRAVLGIAGVAVRAGARSTFASLWRVNDRSTAEFMRLLYKELLTANETGTVNKAKALQKVQLDFLKNYPDTDWNQPYYWASFVLIGNWL